MTALRLHIYDIFMFVLNQRRLFSNLMPFAFITIRILSLAFVQISHHYCINQREHMHWLYLTQLIGYGKFPLETMDHGGFNRRDSHPLSSCRRWFHTLRSFWLFWHCSCWNKRHVGVWDALSQVRFPNPLAVGEPDHPITCWHGLYHFYLFQLTMAWQDPCSTRLVGYCTQLQHKRMMPILSLFGIRKIPYLIDMLVWAAKEWHCMQ